MWSNVAPILKRFFSSNKKVLFLVFVFSIIAVITPVITVIMPRELIKEIELGDSFRNVIIIAFGASVMSIVASTSTNFFSNQIKKEISFFRYKMSSLISLKVMQVDYSKTEEAGFLKLYHHADRATLYRGDGLDGFLNGVIMIPQQTIIIVGMSGILSMLNPLVAVIIICLSLCNYYTGVWFGKKQQEAEEAFVPIRRQYDHLENIMFDYRYGKEIRIFRIQNLFYKKLTQRLKLEYDHSYKINKLGFREKCIYSGISLVQDGLLYAYLVYMIFIGKISVADFTMYLAAIYSLSSSVTNFLMNFVSINKNGHRVSQIVELLAIPNRDEITVDKSLRSLLDNPEEIDIEFCNVSFRYPGQESYALRNVSVKLDNKTKIGMVGKNGAGKTTFVKLMLRLYDPTEGKILINGVDVTRISKKEYYQLFTVAFQDSEIFDFTLYENITFKSNGNDDDSQLHGVLDAMGLNDVVSDLELKGDTLLSKVLDERGIELSGGQAQKVAIARALYKNAPMIVLDEPNSSLDPIAEKELYERITSIVGDKGVIFISHRLSSIRFLDSILVFKDGSICEAGTHELLMGQRGHYFELFSLQAQYYLDTTG